MVVGRDEVAEVARWADGIERAHERIAGRFRRPEPRRRALAYLRGLLSSVERKNGWQLAEQAGDATPDGVQRLLYNYRWDADLVRDDLGDYVVEHLGCADGVVVVDVSRAAAKWTTGAAERWTTCMVAVGWSGRVGDRIGECEPTGVLRGLGVDRVVRSLGHGILAAALEAVALSVHLQDVDVVGEPVQQCPGEPF